MVKKIKYVVSKIRHGQAIDPKEYEEDDIEDACKDMICRLAKNEARRKKKLYDWASSVNWALRTSGSPKPFIMSKPNENKMGEK